MTTATPTLTPQLIGQTEKTLNAILTRKLEGTGLTEPLWVTLTFTAKSGSAVDRDELAGRIAKAVAVSDDEASTRIAKLIALGLLAEKDKTVRLTDAGVQLHASIRAENAEVTQRLWDDLAATDLEIAGRVLSTVLERAASELVAT